MSSVVGSRVFTAAEQAAFAALSGDFNPMHVDAVAARRTGAGAPVVHGVHNLLWCLDSAARTLDGAPPVASLRVNFDTFVTIDEPVEAVLAQSDAARARVEAHVGGVTALTALLAFGEKRVAAPAAQPAAFIEATTPIDFDPAEGVRAGRLAFATPAEAMARGFPHAARLLGARRLAALGAFTRLVGMVVPGLHSIFNRIALEACDDDGSDEIGFAVTSLNTEHRRIVCAVWGGGWSGTLTTMMRHRPTAQPAMAQLAATVGPDEFSSAIALVVGGSRGLGEVVAKLVAAGGGRAIITYASGQADAARVAREIEAAGGACATLRLDVSRPIAGQIAGLDETPNQLYYFATPMIGGRRAGLFDAERLAAFTQFYVAGFYDCVQAVLARRPARLDALYPSSVFVEERPAGVTEYAMAKAAGEQLCRDMTGGLPGFRALVARLPRLATDQNPGLGPDGQGAADALLPLIRDMMGGNPG